MVVCVVVLDSRITIEIVVETRGVRSNVKAVVQIGPQRASPADDARLRSAGGTRSRIHESARTITCAVVRGRVVNVTRRSACAVRKVVDENLRKHGLHRAGEHNRQKREKHPCRSGGYFLRFHCTNFP